MTEPNLLIVDDDAVFLDILFRYFCRAGFSVTAVPHAEAALAAAQETPFSVALVDRGLPDMDGLELVKRLFATDSLSCIVLSGHADGEEEVRLSGAFASLVKPCGLSEIRRVVEQAVVTGPISSSS